MGNLGDPPIFRCEKCGEEYRPSFRQRLEQTEKGAARHCIFCEVAEDLSRPTNHGRKAE